MIRHHDNRLSVGRHLNRTKGDTVCDNIAAIFMLDDLALETAPIRSDSFVNAYVLLKKVSTPFSVKQSSCGPMTTRMVFSVWEKSSGVTFLFLIFGRVVFGAAKPISSPPPIFLP